MRIEIMNIKHIASGKCGYYILISCYFKNIIIAVLLPYAVCIIWFYGKLTLSLDFLLLSNYIYHSMHRAIFQNYKPNLIHQPKNPRICLGKTIVIFAPAMFSTYFHYQHLQYWIEVVCIIIYISKCTTYSVSIVYNRVLDTC